MSKDLEETIKKEVSSLIQETMEKNWGVAIPKVGEDITDKLSLPLLDVYVPLDTNFVEAKKIFKSAFLKKELRLHLGNISQLAKSLGLDRRSIHRAIKEFRIPKQEVSKEEYQQEIIGKTIKGTLDDYKEIIRPQKMEKMYEDVKILSRNIAKCIPHRELSWKEAEKEFEKVFFRHALEENEWNVARTAVKIEIRVETLHRKIKKLALKTFS
jgi:DNA-binding NtrC family response regulator